MSKLKYTGLLIVCILIVAAKGGKAQGFVQTDVIKQAGITNDAQINGLSNAAKQTSRVYYDGLGRGIQSVAMEASPLNNDVVAPVQYNSLGQQTISYLPYAASTTDASYHSNAIAEQSAFYSNGTADKVADDNSPFSQQVFENSPMQRVLQAGLVGSGYQPGASGTQYYKTVSYRTNTSGDNVTQWNPDGTYSGGAYAQNTLSVTDGKDEDNTETLSFTDMMGRLILKRQLNPAGPVYNYDTYYLYNAAGQVSYVIPPKAVTAMAAAGNYGPEQSGTVSTLIFKYVYDGRGRLVEKTVPGAGVVYMVYDPLSRPVLVQDANLRVNNQWNYIKYDVMSRPVSQGIYTDNIYTARANVNGNTNGMQDYVNSLGSNYATSWYEGRSASLPGYYTNNIFPTANISALAYSYYDNYDINDDGSPDYSYQNQGFTGEAATTDISALKSRGMVTGVSTRTVGVGLSNIWLLKVMFYDSRGRMIQSQGNNHIYYAPGVLTDVSTTLPDFIGKPITTKTAKQTGASTTTTVQTAYTYDNNSRILAVDQYYNGSTVVTNIATYEYNEIGQLVKKNLGPTNGGAAVPANVSLDGSRSLTTAGQNLTVVASQSITMGVGFQMTNGATMNASIAQTTYLQSLDYRYNIKGQLLTINNSTLSNDNGTTNNDTNDLFGMTLLYDQQDGTLYNGAGNTAYHNGKLSAVKWMNKDANGNSTAEKSYVYNYDPLNRLTGANYSERTAGSTGNFGNNVDAFDENGIQYDENGNITQLNRTSGGTNIDQLAYSYNGNQLTAVADNSGNTAGFMYNGTYGISYGYDANGNITTDPYKGLTNYYNMMNRVEHTTINSKGTIYYTYTASGTLLRKQQYNTANALQKTIDYIDGFEYEQGALNYFGMPEGRVLSTGGALKLEFIMSDQQGNARISFDNSGTGGIAQVKQENSYYAFGMTYQSITPGNPNLNLYNGGSEWQRDYGDQLPGYYQTFYRNYDAALGRWISVDPEAESTESMTTYQYSMNNPVMFNDPMGNKVPLPGSKGGPSGPAPDEFAENSEYSGDGPDDTGWGGIEMVQDGTVPAASFDEQWASIFGRADIHPGENGGWMLGNSYQSTSPAASNSNQQNPGNLSKINDALAAWYNGNADVQYAKGGINVSYYKALPGVQNSINLVTVFIEVPNIVIDNFWENSVEHFANGGGYPQFINASALTSQTVTMSSVQAKFASDNNGARMQKGDIIDGVQFLNKRDDAGLAFGKLKLQYEGGSQFSIFPDMYDFNIETNKLFTERNLGTVIDAGINYERKAFSTGKGGNYYNVFLGVITLH